MSCLRGRSAEKDTLTLYLKCDQLQLTFRKRVKEVQPPPPPLKRRMEKHYQTQRGGRRRRHCTNQPAATSTFTKDMQMSLKLVRRIGLLQKRRRHDIKGSVCRTRLGGLLCFVSAFCVQTEWKVFKSPGWKHFSGIPGWSTMFLV